MKESTLLLLTIEDATHQESHMLGSCEKCTDLVLEDQYDFRSKGLPTVSFPPQRGFLCESGSDLKNPIASIGRTKSGCKIEGSKEDSEELPLSLIHI